MPKYCNKPRFEKIPKNPKRERFRDNKLSIKKQSTARTLNKVVKILYENSYSYIVRKNMHNSESRYVYIFDNVPYSNEQVALRISMHTNEVANINGPYIDMYVDTFREGAINIQQLISVLNEYFKHTIQGGSC